MEAYAEVDRKHVIWLDGSVVHTEELCQEYNDLRAQLEQMRRIEKIAEARGYLLVDWLDKYGDADEYDTTLGKATRAALAEGESKELGE